MRLWAWSVGLAGGLALAGLIAGCASTAPSGSAFTPGADRELKTFFARDHEDVYHAAVRAVELDFKYRITRQEFDYAQSVIEARTANEENVRVETYRASDFMTRMRVYVGPAGDPEAEWQLLDAIATRLNR